MSHLLPHPRSLLASGGNTSARTTLHLLLLQQLPHSCDPMALSLSAGLLLLLLGEPGACSCPT